MAERVTVTRVLCAPCQTLLKRNKFPLRSVLTPLITSPTVMTGRSQSTTATRLPRTGANRDSIIRLQSNARPLGVAAPRQQRTTNGSSSWDGPSAEEDEGRLSRSK